MKITKKTLFCEVLNKYPESIKIFLKYGMHCVMCPAASSETIEQGALAHGVDPEKLVKELNKAIKKKKKTK